jgi:NAD(P)-dependent dehydrogenase (short-subunit alcohol dehydrogenase family)
MGSLESRICIVTGAARGIGAEIAREFGRRGACVIVTDLDGQGAGRVAEQICLERGHAVAYAHDVSDENRWREIVEATVAAHGGLDVLVNNAGIVLSAPVDEMTLEEWRRVSSVNLDGVFLGTKHAVLAMKEIERRKLSSGSIINMSSIGGLRGAAMMSAYCMSKGGVRLFTKAVAAECGPFNIRANSIHPGLIDTEMGTAVLRLRMGDMSADDMKRTAGAAYPLGRIGAASDVANAAAFLASDESAYVTGMEMVVDGGVSAR